VFFKFNNDIVLTQVEDDVEGIINLMGSSDVMSWWMKNVKDGSVI
jgi:hypothetical protein